MKKRNIAKFLIITAFAVFYVNFASIKDTVSASADETAKIKNYKSWTKVNLEPQVMWSEVAALCRAPSQKETDDDIHNNKYINVYINSIGKNEMLTKKEPKFPVGTIIVKEKLYNPESKNPLLLTVMIKRKEGFNPQVGNWEFLTLNGDATEITSRGKIESCQGCHLKYKQTDFITRTYLPDKLKKKLK